MRGLDPLSELRVRMVKGGAGDAELREKFAGIRMTDKEARADVATMPHVTFLRGRRRIPSSRKCRAFPKNTKRPEGRSELLRRSRTGRRRVGQRRCHTQEPVSVRAPESQAGDKRPASGRCCTAKRRSGSLGKAGVRPLATYVPKPTPTDRSRIGHRSNGLFARRSGVSALMMAISRHSAVRPLWSASGLEPARASRIRVLSGGKNKPRALVIYRSVSDAPSVIARNSCTKQPRGLRCAAPGLLRLLDRNKRL